ncbi:hypothetical protein BAE44_0012957 [Dichanthelium oligosanthes]|uniref:Uncharacterized protein n=1 Tax=Dichanthelium oligosanthes TaxID=888268 RepID=A0A1E5VLT9_9POAL|nr:hypothetical protein BAE44_0012957 [Dichanthelium oligosanthes]
MGRLQPPPPLHDLRLRPRRSCPKHRRPYIYGTARPRALDGVRLILSSTPRASKAAACLESNYNMPEHAKELLSELVTRLTVEKAISEEADNRLITSTNLVQWLRRLHGAAQEAEDANSRLMRQVSPASARIYTPKHQVKVTAFNIELNVVQFYKPDDPALKGIRSGATVCVKAGALKKWGAPTMAV